MQIEESLERFEVQLEADGRSPHTIAQYRRHVRSFAHWSAQVGHSGEITEVTHGEVARFLISPVARLRPDGKEKKATTVNALRTSIRCFFYYIHTSGEISENPARLVRRAICQRPLPRTLSELEVSRLLLTLAKGRGDEDRRDSVLFNLILETGIRLGSAVALDCQDVDVDGGVLWLRKTKGDRPSRVFLRGITGLLLLGHMHGRTKGPLFLGRNGKRISRRQVQRRFSQWVEKAGISRPASVHALRHRFAISLYHRTGDILIVKEALGHRSIASTLIYAQCDEKRLRRALKG